MWSQQNNVVEGEKRGREWNAGRKYGGDSEKGGSGVLHGGEPGDGCSVGWSKRGPPSDSEEVAVCHKGGSDGDGHSWDGQDTTLRERTWREGQLWCQDRELEGKEKKKKEKQPGEQSANTERK